DASHVGKEVAADRFELGPDARPDSLHAGREAVDVEDLEVGGSETGERHAGASSGIPRVRIEGEDRPTDALEVEAAQVGRRQARGGGLGDLVRDGLEGSEVGDG